MFKILVLRSRCLDNIFCERLWRSLKYEEIYLKAYATVVEAGAQIGKWFGFYNVKDLAERWIA